MSIERSSNPGLERFVSVQNTLRAAGALAIAGVVYGVLKTVQRVRPIEQHIEMPDPYQLLEWQEPEDGLTGVG